MAVTDGAWTYARNREWSEVHEAKGTEGDGSGTPIIEFLFDRAVDPGENVNLVVREPEQANRMRALLREHLAVRDRGIVEADVRIDPTIADRLRANGISALACILHQPTSPRGLDFLCGQWPALRHMARTTAFRVPTSGV
jgi:hypothetical protein